MTTEVRVFHCYPWEHEDDHVLEGLTPCPCEPTIERLPSGIIYVKHRNLGELPKDDDE